VTDDSYGKITSNGADTITTTLSGGKRNSWQVGDQFQVTQREPRTDVRKGWNTDDVFKIVNGYPGLDQIGRVQDADAKNVQPQVHVPLYEWNNTVNGKILEPHVNRGGTSPCAAVDHIKAGRDYFVNTPRPDYKPYTYPHPLTLSPTDLKETSGPLPAPDSVPKEPR